MLTTIARICCACKIRIQVTPTVLVITSILAVTITMLLDCI
jgi:hypothetical protein